MNDENIWAIEPPIIMTEVTETHNERAEKLNGRLAMLGFVAAIGSYVMTGQIIPGIFWWLRKDVKEAREVAAKKATKTRLDKSCWKGYKKSGTKVKGGTRVNNCVKIKK